MTICYSFSCSLLKPQSMKDQKWGLLWVYRNQGTKGISKIVGSSGSSISALNQNNFCGVPWFPFFDVYYSSFRVPWVLDFRRPNKKMKVELFMSTGWHKNIDPVLCSNLAHYLFSTLYWINVRLVLLGTQSPISIHHLITNTETTPKIPHKPHRVVLMADRSITAQPAPATEFAIPNATLKGVVLTEATADHLHL